MDFNLTPEQDAVAEAAGKLFAGHLDDERRAAVAQAGEGIDRVLWAALAEADLLGLAVDAEFGGSGQGFEAVAVLLEEAGRAAAPVPLWAALVLGGLPVARFGSDDLRRRLLVPLAAGELVLTAALVEAGSDPAAAQAAAPLQTAAPHASAQRAAPLDSAALQAAPLQTVAALQAAPLQTVARRHGDGWVLDGSKTCVSAGTIAGAILVPARTGETDVGVFVVDPTAPGTTVIRLETTTGIPEARLEFAGTRVAAGDVLGDPFHGREVMDWLLARASAGLCALMAGTCREAVRLTAAYAATRQQFGRYIATFQAVGQRAADAYIDAEAVTLTARQAVWRLATDRPAAEQVAIAKFWAAEGGQRVVHAAQHIHGGIGVDRSYPLHRYFLAAKQLELTLGGATPSLVRLGALMAGEPV